MHTPADEHERLARQMMIPPVLLEISRQDAHLRHCLKMWTESPGRSMDDALDYYIVHVTSVLTHWQREIDGSDHGLFRMLWITHRGWGVFERSTVEHAEFLAWLFSWGMKTMVWRMMSIGQAILGYCVGA